MPISGNSPRLLLPANNATIAVNNGLTTEHWNEEM